MTSFISLCRFNLIVPRAMRKKWIEKFVTASFCLCHSPCFFWSRNVKLSLLTRRGERKGAQDDDTQSFWEIETRWALDNWMKGVNSFQRARQYQYGLVKPLSNRMWEHGVGGGDDDGFENEDYENKTKWKKMRKLVIDRPRFLEVHRLNDMM